MELPANIPPSEQSVPSQRPDFSADELLDTQPLGVLVLDEQHTIRRVNQLAARWCGTLPEALLGKTLLEADLPPGVEATLRQLLEPGEAAPREVWLPQLEQWIALSSTRRPGGWVIHGQDITPQKRREQQYQALAENTPDVITRWGPDLRLRYANAAFADKAGVPLIELLGRTNREMGQPEDIAGPYMAALQRVFDTGQPQEHFNSFPTPHGEVHYYSRLVPELRYGQVETVLGIARDITELKQAEAVSLRRVAAADGFRLQLADALGPLADPVAIQEAVTRLTRQHFSADHCYYCELEDGQGIIRHDAAADGRPSLAGTYALADLDLLRAAIEAGRPFVVADVRTAEDVDEGQRQLCLQLQLLSYLHVPVIKNGQPAGVFSLVQSAPRQWTPDEVSLAVEVAERTWAAVERARAEEDLRQSEEELRLLVTTTSDTVYRLSADCTQLEQLISQDFLADTLRPSRTWTNHYIPDEDLPLVQATIADAIGRKGPLELEHRVQQADGTMGWAHSRAVPVLDAQGEVTSWLGAATNITARKQVEEALRRSEERLQLALQAGHMGSFEWTSADNRLRLSSLSEQVLGLLPGAAVATSDTGLTLVHPDDRARQQMVFEQASRTGEDFHSIYRIVRPRDGQVRWLEERGQGTRDPTTGIIQLRGVHWDVTERVQAQQQLAEFTTQLEQQVSARTQELQESRDLLQTVFDASPIAIVVLHILRDAAGQAEDFEILIHNEFNKQVVGRDDLAGQRFTAMFPQTGPTGVLARLLAVATTGEPADFEHWYEGEGMLHWFRQIAVRQDGLLVLTAEVITARKQAELERLTTLHLLQQAEAVAGLGSWDYELATGQFTWSEGMYRLFDLPLGQPVEPDIYLDYVVNEDQPLAEWLVRQVTAGAGDFEQTVRLRVGEQVKTVRIKAVVLPDEAGQPARVLGVDLDISQLQRLEQENLRLRLTQQHALFEAVQAAQEAERKRMAESLHNGIGQMLYATKLRLDQLHTPVLHTLPALVAARNEADKLLSEAIRQTRALSHELVPIALEEFGLAIALRDISRKMSTPQLRFNCQVVFDEDAAPLTPALQLALYRMAQELAQNIVKHAIGATEASLELETMPGWVLLRAEDNGAGFAPASVEHPGLGLRSICDRVALLGGQLEMGLALEGGAYVRIRLPLAISPTL